MKIVIIEDERLTAEDLASTINELRPGYEIVKFLSSVKESKAYFEKHDDFGLIFSDIHLGDGLSFDIYNSIPIKKPIIFCTAFDNHAIEAFKSNGIDYVLKPFNKKSILEAIEKFERLSPPVQDMNSNMVALMNLFKQNSNDNLHKSIIVHVKDKIIPIKLEDIAVFYIKNEMTSIMDFHGKTFSIGETLEEIEQLDLPFLFRANRQFVINREVVKDASQHFARKLIVNLNLPFSEQITVSKEKTPLFLNWLKNN
jgi:two-component system, LytTR family, response regulator LytT